MAAVEGKGRAQAGENALEEGLRLAKAGLPERAVAIYREIRRHTRDPVVVVESLRLEAYALQAHGQWSAALDAARESHRLATELERSDLVAEAMNAEAAVHYGRGEFDEAVPLFQGMLELTDDPRIRGLAHQNLGIIHGRLEEADLAESRLLEAFGEFERAGYDWGMAHVQNNRACNAEDCGDHELAAELARDAMARARKVDDLDLLAISSLNYAEALAGMGQLNEAEEHASTALGYFSAAGNAWRRISCYQVLGDVHEAQGDTELARRFWKDGMELARELGASAEMERLEERLSR